MRQSPVGPVGDEDLEAFMPHIVATGARARPIWSAQARFLRAAFVTMAPDPITRIQRSLNYDTPPGLEVAAGSQGKIVRLSGQWTALALARDRATGKVVPRLRSLIGVEGMHWDLSRIERMDHVGGQALWRVW